MPPLLPLFAEKANGTAKTAEGLFTSGERGRLPARLPRPASSPPATRRRWRPRSASSSRCGCGGAPRRWATWRPTEVEAAFAAARFGREDAAELHRLTTFATLEQRVVLPPALRGEAFDAATASTRSGALP